MCDDSYLNFDSSLDRENKSISHGRSTKWGTL